MTAALILTGAPGSGKTSVLDALSTLLEIDEIHFGALEAEELARGWPWLAPAHWFRQLTAVIGLQRDAGRELFLIVATVESDGELRALRRAVGAERTMVICLYASPQLAARRVAAREPDAWPGKAALVRHARTLAAAIPKLAGVDRLISTAGRQPAEVAAEIKELLTELRYPR